MANKGERRQGAWALAGELDRVALPLVDSLGVEEAYRRAASFLRWRRATEMLGLPAVEGSSSKAAGELGHGAGRRS